MTAADAINAINAINAIQAQTGYMAVGQFRLPLRTMEVNGEQLTVPRGLARNARSKSWQLKLVKNKDLIATGSMADTLPTAQDNLDLAVQELIRQVKGYKSSTSQTVSKDKRIKLAPEESEIKLKWQVSNGTTPSLAAIVYMPSAKRDKVVSVGSDRAIERNPDLLTVKLAEAVVIEGRERRNEADPLREVTEQELFEVVYLVDRFVEADHVQAYLKLGTEIRKDLEANREEKQTPLVQQVMRRLAARN